MLSSLWSLPNWHIWIPRKRLSTAGQDFPIIFFYSLVYKVWPMDQIHMLREFWLAFKELAKSHKQWFAVSRLLHCFDHFLKELRFKVFTVVNIQVMFFWVVMLYSVVVGYQHFRGPCCLHIQGELHGITTQRTSTWILKKGSHFALCCFMIF
jgi:hypothetical protein